MNLKYCFDGDLNGVEIERTQDGYVAMVDGQTYQITLDHLGDGELCFRVDDQPLDFYWAAEGPLRWVWLNGQTFLLDKRTSLARGGAGIHLAEKILRSPMPGQITAINVGPSDGVEKGQTLILMEAMKMEIRVQAPQDGQVERVLVEVGQTVERNQALVELVNNHMTGKYFEELEEGAVYKHSRGRTITEMDNVMFSALTLNDQALHINEDFASQTQFGQRIVNGILTLGLVVGLSVNELTDGTILANLGYDKVSHPAPVFHGDTIYAETEVLSKRESKSRPECGVVRLKQTGRNQDGAIVVELERTVLFLRDEAGEN